MCKSFFKYFCPTGKIDDDATHEHNQEVYISVVDDLWDQYDDDGNGELDRSETKKFLRECMKNLNKNQSNVEDISDEAYDALFNHIDRDKNGRIDK